MSEDHLDPQIVQRLANRSGLSLDRSRAERLAPALGALLQQARRLRPLDLDGVEPAWSVQLEAGERG